MTDVDANRHSPVYPESMIDLGSIEREIFALWRLPTLMGLHDAELVPTRTGVLNLVVVASSEAIASQAEHLISQLAAHHPSRSIVVSAGDDPSSRNPNTNTRVSAHCTTTTGERFAACFDQISITTPQDVLEYVPSLLPPLLLPDLPTFLWWPGQPPLSDRRFLRLVQNVDRLVVDSLDFKQGMTNLVRMSDLCRKFGTRCVISDLNWARLTHCRELAAQFFDMPHCSWALDRVSRVSIQYGHSHGAPDNPIQALLFAGWIASRLGWILVSASRERADWSHIVVRSPEGREVTIDIHKQPAPRAFNGYILNTNIIAEDGHQQARFATERIANLSTMRMSCSMGNQVSIQQAIYASPPHVRTLLSRELELLERDPPLEDALFEASNYARQLRNRGKA